MIFFRLLFCLLIPAWVMAQQEELPVPGQNLFVNKINCLQSQFPDLNGSGTTISVKEFGFDTADVDFRGRIANSPYAAANLSTHANIMASLIGGAGNSDWAGRGAAPGCKLASSSFEGLQPDPDYTTQKITVQNHSYGVDIQNWYGTGAVAYDRNTIENPLLLHVFSAGNKGDSASLSGNYAQISGFANLSGNFKMAKNVLLVGSVDSFGKVAPLSSRGPAFDGRIKPDLVAFGQDGSSGAAALVSGGAAVVQQTLSEFSTTLPYSSLVRAILINSADDILAPGPDYESGFGNLNLKKAVLVALENRFSTGTIMQGQTISIPLSVPSKLRQLKIILSWNDPPADLLAPKALLHDLDIRLLDPMGNVFFPWVLNSFPNPDSLRQAARQGRDSLNNVEQVTLDFPIAGVWDIQISAPSVMNISQEFALAWSWDTLQQFEWTYPVENDPAPANREVVLRWETNFPDTIAVLEWRPTFSATWRLIDDSVTLQRGWRRWILPDTFTEAQLRMRMGGYEFQSDIFMISKELRMKIGFNCPDSAMLFWNAASPDAHYALFGLGSRYMEWITELTDTFFILQKSQFPQQRFAVAALAQGNAFGPRSPAPDISNQGVTCYFSNFLAELNPENQVDLILTVGTSYGLSRVFFEKIVAGAFVPIAEQAADRELYYFTDENPLVGENTYRVRLLLVNGSVLLSEPAQVYFAGKNNWWIFPNPVAASGALQVITSGLEAAEFSLFDVLGQAVLTKNLDDLRIEIPMEGLPRGIYFFSIQDGRDFVGAGKLVVR